MAQELIAPQIPESFKGLLTNSKIVCKWIAGKLRDEAKLDYSTTLVAKLNIMKMAEISMALGCRRFNRSLSG